MYIFTFKMVLITQSALQHLHPISHTDVLGRLARCQLHLRSNFVFSVLLKDTSTCSSAQQGGVGIRASDPLITS